MEHSKFQYRIYDEVANADTNIIINAVAGSGKTTTVEYCLKLVPEDADVIYLAFNNSIVDELKKRIDTKKISVSTMHSFCWRNLMKAKGFKKVKLRPNKSISYINSICLAYNISKKRYAYYFYILGMLADMIRMNMATDIESIINLALHHDILIDETEAEMALKLIDRMDDEHRLFDYTDMIHRVIKDNISLPKFDYVFIDESQDLSILQQEVIRRIKKRNGRLISVGDPNQAIYGFAGSDTNSYQKLKGLFKDTIELPLSVNYRCGKRIVHEAQKINDQILPFEKSIEGEVRNGLLEEIKSGDWVLCRNTKPLILLNLYLLSIGKKSYVKGVDIGIGLNSLVMSLDCISIRDMLNKYQYVIDKERQKIAKLGVKNPDNTEKIFNMNQKFDILYVLSNGLYTTTELRAKIKTIFKDKADGIVLSTIHKAKGLENDNIFIICRELMPSKFATQEWQLKQEQNLEYVAITRAKKKLIYVTDYNEVIKDYSVELLKLRKEYEKSRID